MNITINKIKVWAFQDKYEGFIYKPDICPFFATRTEARLEKKKYPEYYEGTKIVACEVRLIN